MKASLTQSLAGEQLRKVVGRPIEELSLFDRIRRLQSSLKKMGLQQEKQNDGEHIRRTVGVTPKK